MNRIPEKNKALNMVLSLEGHSPIDIMRRYQVVVVDSRCDGK